MLCVCAAVFLMLVLYTLFYSEMTDQTICHEYNSYDGFMVNLYNVFICLLTDSACYYVAIPCIIGQK